MLSIFFNLCFLLLIVVFGFGDTTSKHKNLEPSENQNCKLFFIFILLSASNLWSMFSLFHIFLSFLAFTFQETEVSSHKALQQVVLPGPTQILMCTSHFFQDFVCSSNQSYCSPNSLLLSTLFSSSIRVSIFIWFGICSSQIKVADLCPICIEWEFNLKLINMHLNIVQATLVRYGLKLQIWKY